MARAPARSYACATATRSVCGKLPPEGLLRFYLGDDSSVSSGQCSGHPSRIVVSDRRASTIRRERTELFALASHNVFESVHATPRVARASFSLAAPLSIERSAMPTPSRNVPVTPTGCRRAGGIEHHRGTQWPCFAAQNGAQLIARCVVMRRGPRGAPARRGRVPHPPG